MPSHSRDSFLQATLSCYNDYFILLSNVDAKYSFCSRLEDQKSIHKAIADSIGFDGLNRSIYSVISQWIIDQIKLLIASIKDKDPLASIPRMKDLGMILKEMGRYEEALHVLQEASQMFVKFGSVAPQSFETKFNSVDSQIGRQIVRIYVHLGHYDLAQSQHDSLFARSMSGIEREHSKKHGSKMKDCWRDQDQACEKAVTASLAVKVAEMSQEHPKDSHLGICLQKIAEEMRQKSEGISTTQNASAILPKPVWMQEWNSYEYLSIIMQMYFYNLLVCEDAEDPEILKAYGCESEFDLCLLEDAISDPLSNVKFKKKAFDLKSNRLPLAHPAVALAMLRLAHAYILSDQSELALPLLQFCIPLLRRLPPLHSNIALSLLLRSACLFKNCDLISASSDLLEALFMCKDVKVGRMAVMADIRFLQEAAMFFQEHVNKMDNPEFRPQLENLASEVLKLIKIKIEKIGCEEALMKKVIINHGRDPRTHNMAQRILEDYRSSREMLKSLKAGTDIETWRRETLKAMRSPNWSNTGAQNDPCVTIAFFLCVHLSLMPQDRQDCFNAVVQSPTLEDSVTQTFSKLWMQSQAAQARGNGSSGGLN
jgi:hypothetical protein